MFDEGGLKLHGLWCVTLTAQYIKTLDHRVGVGSVFQRVRNFYHFKFSLGQAHFYPHFKNYSSEGTTFTKCPSLISSLTNCWTFL